MPQTHEQRKYWANRRKLERTRIKYHLPAARSEVVLLAQSPKEYDEMRRMHSEVKIRLESSDMLQTQLFDTRSLNNA